MNNDIEKIITQVENLVRIGDTADMVNVLLKHVKAMLKEPDAVTHVAEMVMFAGLTCRLIDDEKARGLISHLVAAHMSPAGAATNLISGMLWGELTGDAHDIHEVMGKFRENPGFERLFERE